MHDILQAATGSFDCGFEPIQRRRYPVFNFPIDKKKAVSEGRNYSWMEVLLQSWGEVPDTLVTSQREDFQKGKGEFRKINDKMSLLFIFKSFNCTLQLCISCMMQLAQDVNSHY